ncbi:4Fe-4S dicluster domain-containing protein [Anaerotruncus colihominis]|uniref:4Fe-4S dicluster domain-containing protein n=1 Tax=Anaerotruncus colihominis TaxID=169435 RepID=UPI00174E1B1E|nr:4Fe-4S dicluster domain-containing protein [Anaerotruncus colihominis]
MDVKEMVMNAGILGAGGAGFPTHVKINCQAGAVIVNGAECEPLLRVDQQVMELYAAEIVEGLRLVMEQTGAKEGIIALKKHYEGAVKALGAAIEPFGQLRLHLLREYYPAGDEQQIVYEVTGRVVPTGGLPLDVGAVVCNASTLLNVADAAAGKKVVEKYVTVGGAVRTPRTFKVPVGISCRELLEAAGGTDGPCRYIIGGPCMGRVTDDPDVPVTKTTGGFLAFPVDHPLWKLREETLNMQLIRSVCCQCSMCTQMCPRNALGLNVQPHKAMRTIAQGTDLLGDANGGFSCCNCGVCTYYACNFGLKPSQAMQQMKAMLAQKGVKPRKEVYTRADRSIDDKKLPVKRLIARMGLERYDVDAPLSEKLLPTGQVRIMLRMGVGAPSVPVVGVGDKVRKNTLVADIAPGKLGVKMHASISGTVTAVTDSYIEIRKATV